VADDGGPRVIVSRRLRRCGKSFDSWTQLEAVAERLNDKYGPMVMFAAATGLRPSELFGLERRDIDRVAGVVYVRRAFANRPGQEHQDTAQHTGSPASGRRTRGTRAPPVVRERAALPELAWQPHRLPQLRPAPLGNPRRSQPPSIRSGISTTCAIPMRLLRSALGVSVFAVSQFMGTSLAMIDRHYGHLARDSREHAVSLLDALAVEHAVDAGWTPLSRPATPLRNSVSTPRGPRSRNLVDIPWTSTHESVCSVANGRH